MGDPSSFNRWRLDHGDWVLPFYTSRLMNSGISLSPVRLIGLSSSLVLAP